MSAAEGRRTGGSVGEKVVAASCLMLFAFLSVAGDDWDEIYDDGLAGDTLPRKPTCDCTAHT